MFPIDGGICVCDKNPMDLGKGDCYRCAPHKDKKKLILDATDFVQETMKDGTTRVLERIDVDKLDEAVFSHRKVSLKLRRRRKCYTDSNEELETLQNTSKYAEE